MNIYELLSLAFKVSYFWNDVPVLMQRSMWVCVYECVCVRMCTPMCHLRVSLFVKSHGCPPFPFIIPDCSWSLMLQARFEQMWILVAATTEDSSLFPVFNYVVSLPFSELIVCVHMWVWVPVHVCICEYMSVCCECVSVCVREYVSTCVVCACVWVCVSLNMCITGTQRLTVGVFSNWSFIFTDRVSHWTWHSPPLASLVVSRLQRCACLVSLTSIIDVLPPQVFLCLFWEFKLTPSCLGGRHLSHLPIPTTPLETVLHHTTKASLEYTVYPGWPVTGRVAKACIKFVMHPRLALNSPSFSQVQYPTRLLTLKSGIFPLSFLWACSMLG